MNESERGQLWSALRDAKYQAIQLRMTLDEIERILRAGDPAEPKKKYDGPIEINQHYIWEGENPRARAHVVVTRIETKDRAGVPFDERRIWALVLGDGQTQFEAWNDEGRFREAVQPCDQNGVIRG